MHLGLTPEQRALKIWNANVCSQFSLTSQEVDTALAEAQGDTLEEKRANVLKTIDRARYKPIDLFYLGHDGEVPVQSGIIETNAFGIAIFEGNEKVVRLHAQDNEMKLLDNLKPFNVYKASLITDKLNYSMTTIPTVEIGKSSTFTEAAEDAEKYKALHERCKPIVLDTVSDFTISVDTTDFRIVIGKVVGCHWKYGGRLYLDCKYNSSGTFRVILNGKSDVKDMVGKTVKLLGAIYKDKNAHVYMKCYAIMSINEV